MLQIGFFVWRIRVPPIQKLGDWPVDRHQKFCRIQPLIMKFGTLVYFVQRHFITKKYNFTPAILVYNTNLDGILGDRHISSRKTQSIIIKFGTEQRSNAALQRKMVDFTTHILVSPIYTLGGKMAVTLEQILIKLGISQYFAQFHYDSEIDRFFHTHTVN